MRNTLARIAGHIFNSPLLLLPETAVAIASNLHERFGVERMAEASESAVIEASRFRGTPSARREDGRIFYKVEKGVAVVPVLGELVNRGAWIGASSGLTSYEGLEAQLRAAAADTAVTGILLDMDSPGGEATGCMEAGTLIRSITKTKPVVAFVNGMAASAAYAIAAGANKIVITQTGRVGSIGVVFLHVDRSAALAKAGVTPTLIHAGAHKVDGSTIQALAPEARKRIQAAVDGTYMLFVAHVARHRPITTESVLSTEGGVLMGRDAVSAKLADRVGTLDDAMAMIIGKEPSALTSGFAPTPTLSSSVLLGSADPVSLPSASTVAKLRSLGVRDALAGLPAAAVEVLAAHVTEAIARDRQRCLAIIGHAEAKGREHQARHLALTTDMSVESAIAILQFAPTAKPPTRLPRLYVPDPKLTASVYDDVSDDTTNWNRAVASVNRENGFGGRAG